MNIITNIKYWVQYPRDRKAEELLSGYFDIVDFCRSGIVTA